MFLAYTEWSMLQNDIAQDPKTHGATFCLIILGSDKTTVSVATGQNEYYPLYMSNGLVHNNLCRAHRNAVTLIAFLAIPKSECYLPVCEHRAAAIEYLVTTADREHEDSAEFCIFQRNLFHGSINHILQAL